MPKVLKRKKKRQFSGNQYSKEKKHTAEEHDLLSVSTVDDQTTGDDDCTVPLHDQPTCASKNKIKSFNNQSPIPDVDDYNIIINFGLLTSLFGKMLTCPACSAYEVTIKNDLSQRMGLSYKIVLNCQNCGWKTHKYTSNRLNNNETGLFQINVQTVLAFREIGKGYRPLMTFTSNMNMPPPQMACVYGGQIN